jgi:hypothetical protein
MELLPRHHKYIEATAIGFYRKSDDAIPLHLAVPSASGFGLGYLDHLEGTGFLPQAAKPLSGRNERGFNDSFLGTHSFTFW